MPVVVKYVVERNGTEKMTFTSKAEADAYDKLLDTAEQLELLLEQCPSLENDGQIADIAMFLAEQKDDVICALNNKKKSTKSMGKKAKATTATSGNGVEGNGATSAKEREAKANKVLDELVIEPEETEQYNDDEGLDYSVSDDVTNVDDYAEHAA